MATKTNKAPQIITAKMEASGWRWRTERSADGKYHSERVTADVEITIDIDAILAHPDIIGRCLTTKTGTAKVLYGTITLKRVGRVSVSAVEAC